MNEFLPQKSFKNIWIFFFVFGALFVLGLWLIFGDYSVGNVVKSISESNPRLIMGLIFSGFALLALLFLWWKTSSNKPLYIINNDSLIIKPFGIFASPKKFDFSEIQNVEKISALEIQNLTTRLLRDAEWDKWTFQWSSMMREQMKFMKLIQYCSLPITIDKVKIGFRNSSIQGIPVYLKTQASGDFVLLSLKDGGRYLISPQRVDEFLNQLSINKQ